MRVYLGGLYFVLSGLDDQSIKCVSEAWGPFASLTSSLEIKDQQADQQADVNIEFIFTSPPKNQRFDYQRGSDVALLRESLNQSKSLDDLYLIRSWVDGSLGSLEATLQIALQWKLATYGGLLVHASAGVYQGRGWLIPGVSGAGKSTAVREGGFDQVLSDEMVIVRPKQNGQQLFYQLYSTPFWSEGRSAPLVIAEAPLSMIAFPYKSSRVELLVCGSSEAVLALLRAVTCYEPCQGTHPQNDPTITLSERLFESTCRVVENTPHRRLAFTKYGPWRALLVDQEPPSRSRAIK